MIASADGPWPPPDFLEAQVTRYLELDDKRKRGALSRSEVDELNRWVEKIQPELKKLPEYQDELLRQQRARYPIRRR